MQTTMTTTGFMNGDRIEESGIHSDHRQGTVRSDQNGGSAVWVSWDEFTTREGHRLESRMGWQCVDHIRLVEAENASTGAPTMQTTTAAGYIQIMLSKDDAGQIQADVWSVGDQERVAWSTGVADMAEAVRYAVHLAGACGMEFRPSILINYAL